MSISTIRRQVKNVAYNFSDAQIKVREATSNDPWGPSTAQMSEITDLMTQNPMAFNEIMSIVWKRMNDSGKNWRHVYKSLILLDFMIKCGQEKVTQQCRENLFTIDTLKDFQYVEENRDQGINIREKAKQITGLLSDNEQLKQERTRFMMTRNTFKLNNSGGVGAENSSSSRRGNTRRNQISDVISALDTDYEDSRPSTITEEELQLQLALAISREECEKAEEVRKSDDVRLQMALEESQKLQKIDRPVITTKETVNSGQLTQSSALDDLLSLGVVGDLQSTSSTSTSSAWNGIDDPWGSAVAAPINDPWASVGQHAGSDPFAPSHPTSAVPTTPSFDLLSGDLLCPTYFLSGEATSTTTNGTTIRKTSPVENFLGENSNLVNLDDLLGSNVPSTIGANPFFTGFTSTAPPANPFVVQQRKATPTLNEMRASASASAAQAPPPPRGIAAVTPIPQDDPFANFF